MNTTLYMNPLSILDDLFGMDNRVFRNMRARAAGRFPPVNVYLDENAILVDVELPGRTAKDVALTLEAQAVVIADRPATVDANGKPVEAPTPNCRGPCPKACVILQLRNRRESIETDTRM